MASEKKTINGKKSASGDLESGLAESQLQVQQTRVRFTGVSKLYFVRLGLILVIAVWSCMSIPFSGSMHFEKLILAAINQIFAVSTILKIYLARFEIKHLASVSLTSPSIREMKLFCYILIHYIATASFYLITINYVKLWKNTPDITISLQDFVDCATAAISVITGFDILYATIIFLLLLLNTIWKYERAQKQQIQDELQQIAKNQPMKRKVKRHSFIVYEP